MNVRVVIRTAGEDHAFVCREPRLRIGRANGNDIVLPGDNVALRHAQVYVDDGRMVLVDLASTTGTFVNMIRAAGPTVLHEDDRITIGDHTLQLYPDADAIATREVDATELRLLVTVALGEPGSREVYADWLEEHGHRDRAEFLRVQEALAALPVLAAERAEPLHRLRTLALSIDLPWRMRVARGRIEGCPESPGCAAEWSSLVRTQCNDARWCARCNRHVFYCPSIQDARHHTRRFDPVVVDVAVPRYQDDLWLYATEGETIYVDTHPDQ